MKKETLFLATAIVTPHSFGMHPIVQRLVIKFTGNALPLQYTTHTHDNGVSVLKFKDQVIYKKALADLNTRGAIFEDCRLVEADFEGQDFTGAEFRRLSARGSSK